MDLTDLIKTVGEIALGALRIRMADDNPNPQPIRQGEEIVGKIGPTGQTAITTLRQAVSEAADRAEEGS